MRFNLRMTVLSSLLFMTVFFTDTAKAYLCVDELREISMKLNELLDAIENLPINTTLPQNLVETISQQLDLVENLIGQAEIIYNDHSLALMQELEITIAPNQFPLAHREQPLIILNIRRFIQRIRDEISFLNITLPYLY